MKYIDAERLKAEVKHLRSEWSGYAWEAVNQVLKIIDSLQQERPKEICSKCIYYGKDDGYCYYPHGGMQSKINENGVYECTGFYEKEQGQPQVADARKMDSLEYWLRQFGMPEENIENCITQIAQGYGACRFLEGIQLGADAVNELARQEQPEMDLASEIEAASKRYPEVSYAKLSRIAKRFYELGQCNARKEENK